MTTTINANNKFQFRSKFQKLLNAENCSAFVSAFNQFCSLNSFDALKVLWKLTYSQESACEEMYKLGLSSPIVSLADISTFRNELRYQYEELVNKDFLQVYPHDNEKLHNAFELLRTHTNPIVAAVIFEHCDTVWDDLSFKNTLSLLKSTKDNRLFGGIRSLRFSAKEAQHLKPFHLEIHDFLSSMEDFFKNEDSIRKKEDVIQGEEKQEVGEEAQNIPAEENAVSPQVAEEECQKEEQHANVETTQKFKSLTPEEILANKDVFEAYAYGHDMNLLVDIANHGFDLNEVMAKVEKIEIFLSAAEKLMS